MGTCKEKQNAESIISRRSIAA